MLNYLKYRRACDIMFGVFMVMWFAVRHVAYLAVCYSIYRDYLEVVTFGCFRGTGPSLEGPFPLPEGYGYLFQPFVDPSGIACQSETTTAVFVFLLLFLQGILMIWFTMIIGVAYRVLSGQGAEDSRSDDEEEIEDEEKLEPPNLTDPEKPLHRQPEFIEVPVPIEVEVGAEDTARRPRSSRRYKKSGGASSSVTLPHDRKELLGRIGCDKGA